MGVKDWLGRLSRRKMPIWLKSEEDGRGIEFVDCRTYVMSLVTGTSDKKIAETFVRLMSSNGEQHIDKFPTDAVEFLCNLQYSNLDSPPDGTLCRAIQMEDKFNIYCYNGILYFARSWTDELVFTVQTQWTNQSLNLIRAFRSRSQWGDDDFCIRVIDFLFKSHCLDMVTPHPLPIEYSTKTAEEIYNYSFTTYGRRAWFATCDDTLGLFSKAKYGFPPFDTSVPRPPNSDK